MDRPRWPLGRRCAGAPGRPPPPDHRCPRNAPATSQGLRVRATSAREATRRARSTSSDRVDAASAEHVIAIEPLVGFLGLAQGHRPHPHLASDQQDAIDEVRCKPPVPAHVEVSDAQHGSGRFAPFVAAASPRGQRPSRQERRRTPARLVVEEDAARDPQVKRGAIRSARDMGRGLGSAYGLSGLRADPSS